MDEKDENRVRETSEELNRAARESYRSAVDRAFEVQKSNMRLSRRFFENWIETLESHTELNRRTLEELTELVREQRETYRKLAGESLDAYTEFLDSAASYHDQLEADEGGGDAEEQTDNPEDVSEVTVWQGTGHGAWEDYLKLLERTGEMNPGSGELPANFWDLPRPEDPEGLVRLAVQEDRR
jgi:uncharacterized coiled-coil protein SlyX